MLLLLVGQLTETCEQSIIYSKSRTAHYRKRVDQCTACPYFSRRSSDVVRHYPGAHYAVGSAERRSLYVFQSIPRLTSNILRMFHCLEPNCRKGDLQRSNLEVHCESEWVSSVSALSCLLIF